MNAVLDLLRQSGEPVALATIRDALGWDAATASAELKRLLKAGAIERRHTPAGLEYALPAVPGQAPAAAQAEASSTPKRATQPRPHTLVAQVVALLEVHGVLSAAQIQTLLPADRAERAASNGLLRATHAGLVCSVKVPGQRTLLYHAATRTVTDAEIAKALRANGWDGASPEEGRGVPPPDSPSKPEPAVDETRPADPVAKPELSGPQPFRLPGADHCDTRDDPVGLYARVCAVTDDTSDLITDGLARNLAPHVLQALLAAQQQLNRAARAIARNLA